MQILLRDFPEVLRRYQQVFIPIGVPVIAGPGAITTAIIYGYQSDTFASDFLLSATVLGVLGILYLTLLSGPLIQRVTGDLPLELIARVFAMILIAITGMMIPMGKNGFKTRGWKLMLAGLIFPLLFLFVL